METEPPGTGSSEMSSLVDDGLLEASDVVGGIALVLVVGEYDLVVVVAAVVGVVTAAAVVGVVPSVGEVSKSGLLVSEGPVHEEEKEGRGIQRGGEGGYRGRGEGDAVIADYMESNSWAIKFQPRNCIATGVCM